MRDVKILVPPNLRPSDWARAYELGDAPGATPYGLDRLAEQHIVVDHDVARPAGRNPRDWVGIARPSRLSRPAGRHPGQAAIAWDEHMAVPLLAKYGASSRTLGAGVIWATDEVAAGHTGLRLHSERRVLQQLDVVWSLSRGQLPLLRSWLDMDPERIVFLPFAIDTEFYTQKPWPTRPMVLSLGNDQHRDINTLFDTFAVIREVRPDVRLVVQTRSRLKAPAGVERIESAPTRQLIDLYAEATVVVVSTRPNLHVSGMTVCLEAMATGRPVVLSRTAGASDYVVEAKTGFLANPGDSSDHARATLRILDDSALAKQLGQEARDHVVTNHNQSGMCQRLAEFLFDARR